MFDTTFLKATIYIQAEVREQYYTDSKAHQGTASQKTITSNRN